MNNIPGLDLENLFVIIFSYFLILLVNRKTNSESPWLLLGVLTFHHAVAYLYAFYLSAPPNEHDHISFIQLASECTGLGYCGYFGEHLYANYLARVLAVGQSVYFVFLVNVLFFVISLYYFLGISDALNLKGNRKVYILLYSMWPSVIYFTTLNYRETFELYLLIAGIYFGLTGSKSDNFMRMLISMMFLFVMGIFHMKGLTFLSPVLFFIVMMYGFSPTVISVAKKVILLMIMTFAVYFSQGLYSEYLKEVSQLKTAHQVQLENTGKASNERPAEKAKEEALSGSRLVFEQNKDIWLSEKDYPDTEPGYIDLFMRKVTFYRASLTWVTMPRTVFVGEISDKSIPEFIGTYLLVYLEYVSSPFIFQVNSLLSLLAYVESTLRLFLFVSSLLLVRRYPQARVLFIVYLTITAMWSIGVVSFGASIRHHIQTNWILVLLGVPLISEYVHRKFRLDNRKIMKMS